MPGFFAFLSGVDVEERSGWRVSGGYICLIWGITEVDRGNS